MGICAQELYQRGISQVPIVQRQIITHAYFHIHLEDGCDIFYRMHTYKTGCVNKDPFSAWPVCCASSDVC